MKKTLFAMTGAVLAMSTVSAKAEAWEQHAQKNEDGAYNIVMITTDQEHYFDQYPEGNGYRARQLLESLGTTFEKHYACSNMSTSSRSVIYTGHHVADTHMQDNTDFAWQGELDPEMTTIGDMVRKAGYYSAYKGKWHMGNSSILSVRENELTDLDAYGFSDWGVEHDFIGSIREGNEIDPLIEQMASDWLSGKGKQLNEQGQSFFLAINLINPHDIMNYNSDPTFKSVTLQLGGAPDDPLYKKSYPTEVSKSWNQDLHDGSVPQSIPDFQDKWATYVGPISTEAGWKEYQDYYFNCIQDSDNHLLGILEKVKELGMLDNTIIIFTSDHGEMHGDHGLKGKGGFIYDRNLHVPLIICHPEVAGGKHISSVTSHLDLAPTIVDMTALDAKQKAELTAGLPGHSLLPLVMGSKRAVRNGALFCFEMISMSAMTSTRDADWNLVTTFDFTKRGFVRGLVTERYSFARYFSPLDYQTPQTIEQLYEHNNVQLYDNVTDPGQMHNLALDKEAYKGLILVLNSQLNRLVAEEIGNDAGTRTGMVVKSIMQKSQGGH